MCMPLDEENENLPPHVYIVFDSHARPNHHPNGSAFLFFADVTDAASYLTELLRVDESLLDQRDLRWQSEMLAAYSAHIFTQANLDDDEDPGRRTKWNTLDTLYETTVELVQARGRTKSLEQKLTELRGENSRLSQKLKEAKEARPVVRDTHDHWNSNYFIRPTQPKNSHSLGEGAIMMESEPYSEFRRTRSNSAYWLLI
jgi:hypothetical protein